jgi:transposase
MGNTVAIRCRLRVKQRERVVAFAAAEGVKPASRHFGLDRRTVRTWLRRWKAGGIAGLPRYPARRKRRVPPTVVALIAQARQEFRWGAPRTHVWLKRTHGLQVNTGTIQRIIRDIGIPVLTKTPKRRSQVEVASSRDNSALTAEPGLSCRFSNENDPVEGVVLVPNPEDSDCSRVNILVDPGCLPRTPVDTGANVSGRR